MVEPAKPEHPYVESEVVEDGDYFCCTFTIGKTCKHENGWYVTIPFFFDLFKKRVYVCSDCGDVLHEDFKLDQKKKAAEMDGSLPEMEEKDCEPSRSG